MKLYRLVLLLCVFIISVSCDVRKEIPVVHIGHAPHDHHAAMYVAAEKGDYFNSVAGVYLKEITYKKEYQLYKGSKLLADVDIDSGTGGIQLIRKLDEKILDISFGGVPAMIEMIDKGSRIKILSPVMTEGAAFVVNDNMPVSSWAEFVDYVKKSDKPVRIGYKVDVSVQNLIFESALKEEQISFSKDLESENADIILVNLHGPNNLIPSLKADVIDGFVVMQPYPALTEYEHSGKIIAQLRSLPPEGRWYDHPCCALAANEEFIEKHSEIVEAMVSLFYYANQYIMANMEESAKITSAWLGTPETVEEQSLPTINYLTEYNDKWDSGIDFWIASLISRGFLTGEVKKAYENSETDKLIYNKTFYDKVRSRKSN